MAYVVRGKNGKVVGTYATRGEAERRIAQLKAGAERLRPFQFAGGRHQGSPSRGPKMEPGYALMLAPDGEHEDVMVSSKADRAKWVGYKRVDGQNMAVWEIDGQLYAQTAVGPRAQHSWRGQPRRHAKAARLGHRRAQRSPARIYGPLGQAQQLVYDYRVSNPRSRAVSILRFVKNTSATKQRGCILCGATGPSWAGDYPETKRAREWANAHIASHLGQHSWPGQPRRHAKAARLGHRRAQRSPAYSLTRIRLNRGGYTSNGRYFGSGGAPVYQLIANDVYVFRALTRAEAVATAEAITNLEESGAGMTDILWKVKRVNPTVGKW